MGKSGRRGQKGDKGSSAADHQHEKPVPEAHTTSSPPDEGPEASDSALVLTDLVKSVEDHRRVEAANPGTDVEVPALEGTLIPKESQERLLEWDPKRTKWLWVTQLERDCAIIAVSKTHGLIKRYDPMRFEELGHEDYNTTPETHTRYQKAYEDQGKNIVNDLLRVGGSHSRNLADVRVYLVDKIRPAIINGVVVELGLYQEIRKALVADNIMLVLDEEHEEGGSSSQPHKTSIEIEGIRGEFPNVFVNGRLLQSRDKHQDPTWFWAMPPPVTEPRKQTSKKKKKVRWADQNETGEPNSTVDTAKVNTAVLLLKNIEDDITGAINGMKHTLGTTEKSSSDKGMELEVKEKCSKLMYWPSKTENNCCSGGTSRTRSLRSLCQTRVPTSHDINQYT
jgi:hypothetical protein